jgi:hypothetical protein
MQVAAKGIYKGRWTQRIHEEWIENLLLDRPDLTRSKLERTREIMNNISDDRLTGFSQKKSPSFNYGDMGMNFARRQTQWGIT